MPLRGLARFSGGQGRPPPELDDDRYDDQMDRDIQSQIFKQLDAQHTPEHDGIPLLTEALFFIIFSFCCLACTCWYSNEVEKWEAKRRESGKRT